MKFGKRNLAAAFGAILGVGMSGQASADVYGVSYLDIDRLGITFAPAALGSGAGLYTFDTDQNAILNGSPDPSAGNDGCFGVFGVFTNCSAGTPTLSGTAQNAPPASASVRGENDYTIFGQVGDYSNSEAAVVSATLVGTPPTHVTSISESNLEGGTSASSSTSVISNTTLNLVFVGGLGTLSVDFFATIDLKTEVNGGDIGLAGAAASASLVLQKGGVTLASWAPTGSSGALPPSLCGPGLTCITTETGPSLNVSRSSSGLPNAVAGSGSYKLDVSGLTDGEYTIALSSTTTTSLVRVPVPVPGTVLLVGTGLLLGARATRRRKS